MPLNLHWEAEGTTWGVVRAFWPPIGASVSRRIRRAPLAPPKYGRSVQPYPEGSQVPRLVARLKARYRSSATETYQVVVYHLKCASTYWSGPNLRLVRRRLFAPFCLGSGGRCDAMMTCVSRSGISSHVHVSQVLHPPRCLSEVITANECTCRPAFRRNGPSTNRSTRRRKHPQPSLILLLQFNRLPGTIGAWCFLALYWH